MDQYVQSQVRTIALAAIRLLVVVFLVMGAGLAHGQNLLTNGGFESGFTGWSNATSGGAAASFSLETSQPYAGTRAMKVVVTNPSTQLHNVQTLGATFTTLPAGTATTITFRARAATAGTTVRFVMQNAVYNQKEFTLSTSWERYSWNHTTAEEDPRLRIQYRSSGTIWLDEIAVESHAIPSSGILVTLDPAIRHQTMDGIGGALTWNSARVVSSPSKATLESLIFDDLGLDIIRLKNWYYPLNWPASTSPSTISPGWQKTNYDANKTFYDWAKKPGRDIKVLLSSWSPPASLKDTGQREGLETSPGSGVYRGTLKKVNGQFVYADVAQYWVDLLDNMNWDPDYLSIQNEPGWLAAHETCDFAPTQTASLPGFAETLDAVYNRIKNRADLPLLVSPESESMPEFLSQVVPLRTRSYLDIYAFHNYNIGDPSATDSSGVISNLNSIRSESNNATSGRKNWMSEFSRGEFDWLDTAHVIHNTLTEGNASAYIYWALVWAAETTPATAHSERVFNIDNAGGYARGNTYYALKHFAKHISRGHRRFEVTKAAGSNANIRVSGYLHPSGNQVTLIVLNTGGTDDTIALRLRGLPVSSATAIRTRQFDITGFPYNALGSVNLANNQTISKNSITTYVINLAETLNSYDPGLLRVDGIQQVGNQVSLTMPSQPGQSFILWKSTTLAAGSWQKVTNAVVTESEGQRIVTDPTPGSDRAFYRVEHDKGL
jgi:glucuronoarabinoxylan endo-1,4-beta-xylanase